MSNSSSNNDNDTDNRTDKESLMSNVDASIEHPSNVSDVISKRVRPVEIGGDSPDRKKASTELSDNDQDTNQVTTDVRIQLTFSDNDNDNDDVENVTNVTHSGNATDTNQVTIDTYMDTRVLAISVTL